MLLVAGVGMWRRGKGKRLVEVVVEEKGGGGGGILVVHRQGPAKPLTLCAPHTQRRTGPRALHWGWQWAGTCIGDTPSRCHPLTSLISMEDLASSVELDLEAIQLPKEKPERIIFSK